MANPNLSRLTSPGANSADLLFLSQFPLPSSNGHGVVLLHIHL